ncbi:MAG: response regulator [Thaumarchaeota archaeon]|nr:response regulator [Nitrososphaerota archaeon]
MTAELLFPSRMGLETIGMSIATSNDSLATLEEVTSHKSPNDSINADVRMPKVTGFELYREIKKHDGGTPMCFLTAFEVPQKEFQRMFPDVHVKAFLRKPIGVAESVTRIGELTDGHDEVGEKLVK